MIQTTEDIIQVIERNQEELTSRMLKELITDHRSGDGNRVRGLWERYKLANAEILSRVPAAYEKVDRRIANDFYADVVDTKTGYMGNEVTVSLDRENFKTDGVLNEEEFGDQRKWLRMFQLMNSVEDQNSELVRSSAAMGVTYRLLYVNKEGEVRMKELPPWEVIYIYDQSIDDPHVAIRYYVVEVQAFGDRTKKEELTVVEWYDAKHITYYIDNGKLQFKLDTSKGINGQDIHLFENVPIVPFPNNKEMTGEPEKVLTLIDAYDAILSSTASEIEQLRLAYMFIKGAGMKVDKEFVRLLEQTGVLPLEETGDAGFINKQLSDVPIQNMLAEIRKNIYQFSKSIDMSKDFGGEMRVIGWQVALLNLENSSKITERKFTKAFYYQYDLLTKYWKTYKGIEIDLYSLDFVFTRNFPRDLKAEAETLNILKNSVSTKTAFELMSFIDDPEEEMARMEQEPDPYRRYLEDGLEPGVPGDPEADREDQ